ncbi:MAG: hypothetical protein IKT35_02525 [Clostridia bacterium]|nr:hypothetical protein [Clostridia bacterium]
MSKNNKSLKKAPLSKKRLITIIGAAIILVLTIAITITGIATKFTFNFFDTPEKAVKRYCDALSSSNYTAFSQSVYGDKVEKEAESFTNKDDYMREYLKDIHENFGDDAKMSAKDFSVFHEETDGGTFVGQDLKALNVTDVATVTCTLTIKGSLDEQSQTADVICFKSHGDWYVYSMAGKQDTTEVPIDTSSVYGAPSTVESTPATK